MKVLITGGKGMLGQDLVRVFSQGHEVLAWDSDDIDITDFENSKSQITNSKPDLLINSAAYNDVDRAESEPEMANQVNGWAVGNLAKVCTELDIPLVHFSTDYVFDGQNRQGYREDDKPNPQSAYGHSKFLGEQELMNNTDKFYLIRLSKLFGRKAGSPGAKKSFVELMLSLAREKDEIDVVDEEHSCPTYSSDLAMLTEVLTRERRPFGIYHGTNSGPATWYEFAKEIFKITGIDVKLNPVPASFFPRLAKRPKYGILLNTKLPPQRPWQEALKEFLNEEI